MRLSKIACLLGWVLVACQTGTTPHPKITLTHSKAGPSEAQALRDFWTNGFVTSSQRESLTKTQNGATRAALAYDAILRGREDQALTHFIQAAADLSEPELSFLYLKEAESLHATRKAIDANLPLLESIASAHPSASAQASARYLASHYCRSLGRFPEAEEHIEHLGFIDDFQMIGSFDNDQGKGFLTSYPPESELDFKKEYEGVIVPLNWRPVPHLDRLGRVPLGEYLSPTKQAAAYLVSFVHAEKAMNVQLRITTSAPVRAWINDDLTISEDGVRWSKLDNVVSAVRLNKGWNKVLLKSSNKNGYWVLGARFTTETGQPLAESRGYRTSSTQQEFEAGAKAQSIDGQFTGVKNLQRRRFLETRALHISGYPEKALRRIQAFRSDNEENFLAIYYAAMSHWDNEELGEAIDLLNLGVEKSKEPLYGFFRKRARFYLQKRLFDKAAIDLERVASEPDATRSALMELAGIHARRGWSVEACKVYEKAKDLYPQSSNTLLGLGRCKLNLGYPHEAIKLAHAAQKQKPGAPEIHKFLAEIAVSQGRFSDAINHQNALIQVRPHDVDALIRLGEIERRQGNEGKAYAHYHEAKALRPDSPSAYQKIGTLHLEEGENDRARTWWREAYKRDPNNSSLADRLAYLEGGEESLADQYAATDQEIKDAIQAAKTLNVSDGAQLVSLLDHEVTEVYNDGSSKRIVSEIWFAVNEQGRDSLIKRHLPRSGRLKIDQIYSIGPRGRRREASSIRNGTVRFRQLEPGSVVVMKYTHHSPSGRFLPNHFAASWFFAGVHRQVREATWHLILPTEREPKIQIHGNVKSKVREQDERKIYSFSSKNVPPLIAESNMPPVHDLLDRVSVTTVRGWDEYVRWELALLSEVFREEPSLKKLVARVTEGAKSTQAKADRIFHFVSEKIRYQQDYENTIAGVKPHACPIVLQRGYGDCKDKSVLFMLMAKEVGIETRFAILRTTDAGAVEREVPNQQFNHAIVYIPAQQGIAKGYFVDPTTDGLDVGNLRHDDQGAVSLVLDPKTGDYEFVEVPYQKPEKERENITFEINVDSENKVQGKGTIEMQGSGASRVRQILRNKELAKKMYQAIGSTIFPGSSLIDGGSPDPKSIWTPLELNLELDLKDVLQRREEKIRLPLPNIFPLGKFVYLKARNTPLRLGIPESFDLLVNVNTTGTLKADYVPKPFRVTAKCFSVNRSTHRKKDKVAIRIQYRRICPEVSTKAYESFRAKVLQANKKLNDFILLRKSRVAGL